MITQPPVHSSRSWGTSMPAIAAAISTCMPSTCRSVGRRRRKETASLVRQYPAVPIMMIANVAASHGCPVMPGSLSAHTNTVAVAAAPSGRPPGGQ